MAERQLSMFDTESTATMTGDGLVRLRQNGPLSKAQQTFNKRVARIEELRATLGRNTARMDKALVYFGQHLHPRMQRLTELRKEFVRAFAPYLNDKRFKGKSDRRAIREIIADQIDDLLQAEGSLAEDDLRAIFERVHRISFERAQQEDLEATRFAMEAVFEDLGIDADLSDFGPEMNEATIAAKLAQISEKIDQEKEEGEQKTRRAQRKTPRQLEKEQRLLMAEELRKKTLGTIYKQLARALHPDLEPDAEVRRKKTTLMQELTLAYRNNDLHTLLRLELEWIERERGDLSRLTDDKVAIYNQVLKEQAEELQEEIAALPYHPRYQALMVMDGPYGERFLTDGPTEAHQLDYQLGHFEKTLARMRTDQAPDEVRNAIWAYRGADRNRYAVEF